MRRLLRHRPSPAMIVALVALFVALGGSSYAAIKIGARNLKSGAVGTRAIANNSVRSKDVRNNSLTNADIANGSLLAHSADTAKTAADAGTLDGLDSTAFTRGNCGIRNGAIHGSARIDGSATFSSSFTTTGVELPYNCSGQTVEARRTAQGFFEVRFNGNPGGVAVATAMQAPSMSPSSLSVSLSRTESGTFVAAISTLGGTLTDWPFVIVLL